MDDGVVVRYVVNWVDGVLEIWENWGTSVYSCWVSLGSRDNCELVLLDELVC